MPIILLCSHYKYFSPISLQYPCFQNTYVIFVIIVQNKMKQNKMKSKNIILLFTLALPLFSCSESQKEYPLAKAQLLNLPL